MFGLLFAPALFCFFDIHVVICLIWLFLSCVLYFFWLWLFCCSLESAWSWYITSFHLNLAFSFVVHLLSGNACFGVVAFCLISMCRPWNYPRWKSTNWVKLTSLFQQETIISSILYSKMHFYSIILHVKLGIIYFEDPTFRIVTASLNLFLDVFLLTLNGARHKSVY